MNDPEGNQSTDMKEMADQTSLTEGTLADSKRKDRHTETALTA